MPEISETRGSDLRGTQPTALRNQVHTMLDTLFDNAMASAIRDTPNAAAAATQTAIAGDICNGALDFISAYLGRDRGN